MKRFASFFLAALLSMGAFAQEVTDSITIFMIGDSTMANKPLKDENQERGWGQMFPLMVQGPVRVENHAVNGRSSLSFINEGRWEKVLSRIKPGDYVIIEFGHNDEKANSPERYTVPGESFDENLRKFVVEAREKGANPILMNSIVRRNFPAETETQQDKTALTSDKSKKLDEMNDAPADGEVLVDTHGLYRDAPRNVAQLLRVPFVDMNTLTHNYVQALGAEKSKELYMWIPAGKYAFCPDGKIDNTHLNIKGGTIVARIAANALAETVPALKQYIKPCCGSSCCAK